MLHTARSSTVGRLIDDGVLKLLDYFINFIGIFKRGGENHNIFHKKKMK